MRGCSARVRGATGRGAAGKVEQGTNTQTNGTTETKQNQKKALDPNVFFSGPEEALDASLL